MEPNYDHMKEYESSSVSKKYVKDKIRELKKTKTFVVGAASSPETRLEELSAETGLKTMYVLCKTKTQTQAESMEKDVVNVFGKVKKNYNVVKNDTPQQVGGGNLVKGANYLYLLTK